MVVSNLPDTIEKRIPKTAGGRLGFSRLAAPETFFENDSIEGVKSLDFADFKQVAFLMQNKLHLTEQGLSKIQSIKSNMNFLRNFN